MCETSVDVEHLPVLYEEVLESLAPVTGGVYIDATLGSGGHAEGVLERSSPDGRLLGIDADPEAIAFAQRRLERFGDRVILVNDNFVNLEQIAVASGFRPADGILFDLGLSSRQLAAAHRGFSFALEGPLDMRFGPTEGPTAADIISTSSEQELARIIREFGEEPRARAVARAIVAARKQGPISTTSRLAEVVASVVPRRPGRIHPATRTFQALRIVVNRELDNLVAALRQAVDLLKPGGRLAVIAFHSLEDRIVKRFFVEEARGCICPPRLPECVCQRRPRLKLTTRKPIVPSTEELNRNPRSRSARLRVAIAL